MTAVQKVSTFLWFDQDAEAAVRLYTSLLPNSRVLQTTRWQKGGPKPEGLLMTARFELAGTEFMALNGGPMFRFSEATSLLVRCDSQREIDDLWGKLCEGGEPGQCGWLKDRYGLSWQIVPTAMLDLFASKDPAAIQRMTAVMMTMQKLDVGKLVAAYQGK